MTFDEINVDAQEETPLPAARSDDSLEMFVPEIQKTDSASADDVAPGEDAIQCRQSSAQLTQQTNSDRSIEIVNHLKRALGALDVARDLEKAVDKKFAALKALEHHVQDRASALESLKQGILDCTAQAEDAVRLRESFESRLADLSEKEQALRAIESNVAALEERARTATTELEHQIGVSETRERQAIETVERLGRAADTIAELEGRVGGCEARAHTAEETIAHVHEVSTRTLAELQQRLKEAEERYQSLDQRITESAQVATSLGALDRQLENLNETIAQQTRALAVNQQVVHRTLDEGQQSAAVVAQLENRIADLLRSHQQLDGVEERMGQLEARAANAVTEFARATRAKTDLEQEGAELLNQVQRITAAADGEAKKLVDLRQEAERYRHEETRSISIILSGLESRMAAIGSSHQQLATVDKQVEQCEQRAASAVTAVTRAMGAKNALERDISELHKQLRRLTKAAQAEAKTLAGLKHQANRHRLNRAVQADADDRSIAQQFGRGASRVWWSLTPNRRAVSGVALVLSVAIVVLAGIVWRIGRAENDPRAKPPLLASRTVSVALLEAVPLLTPTMIGGGQQRPDGNRRGSATLPVPVAQAFASATPVRTTGNDPAGVRNQSVATTGQLPQFFGTLVIESQPTGAKAFVNQQSVGVTPVSLKDLRAGSYVVRVEYGGYERWSTAVTVSAIREARVTARLQRDAGRR
jgi:chromosome segregation ATPase